MRLRRQNRSIEVFDIALMNVVTKAMGAFLVLMLLMLPAYNAMPQAQQEVEQAEAKSRQLEANVAALIRRNDELRSGGAEAEVLSQRAAALERENKELRESKPTTLLITFNWEDCHGTRSTSMFTERT